MTPNELLAQALTQFRVVYVSPDNLTKLLNNAIGAYQDKAGIIRKLTFGDNDTEVNKPSDLLEIIYISDAEGRWHEYQISQEKITVVEQTFPCRPSVKPYSVTYLVNLRDIDLATGVLPSECIGLLREYLEALIAIPNTARERQIALATGIQAEYPTEEELKTRKDNIELAMEDSQAIIPMATVF